MFGLVYTVDVIRRSATLLILLLATLGTAILFYFDPETHDFYPACLFRVVTGLNCPGCGLLRAIHQLLHGHFLAAAELNLLLVLSLPVLVWFAARYWLPGKAMPVAARSAWMWMFCCLSLAFTVTRNAPGFEWLSR